MTTQSQNIIQKIGMNWKDESVLSGEGLNLRLSRDFLERPRSLRELIPIFEMFQAGWIKEVEPLGTVGIRVYMGTNLSQEREQTTQQLHAMLEQVTHTDQYWSVGYVDFVQNNIATKAKDEQDSSFVDNDFDLGLSENFLGEPLPLKKLITVFRLFQNGWIKRIESLDMIGIPYVNVNGIRFHLSRKPSQMLIQAVQILHEILEMTVNAPINIHWSSQYIDFVPI